MKYVVTSRYGTKVTVSNQAIGLGISVQDKPVEVDLNDEQLSYLKENLKTELSVQTPEEFKASQEKKEDKTEEVKEPEKKVEEPPVNPSTISEENPEGNTTGTKSEDLNEKVEEPANPVLPPPPTKTGKEAKK